MIPFAVTPLAVLASSIQVAPPEPFQSLEVRVQILRLHYEDDSLDQWSPPTSSKHGMLLGLAQSNGGMKRPYDWRELEDKLKDKRATAVEILMRLRKARISVRATQNEVMSSIEWERLAVSIVNQLDEKIANVR